jgi:hypothetical protein
MRLSTFASNVISVVASQRDGRLDQGESDGIALGVVAPGSVGLDRIFAPITDALRERLAVQKFAAVVGWIAAGLWCTAAPTRLGAFMTAAAFVGLMRASLWRSGLLQLKLWIPFLIVACAVRWA